MFQLPGPYFNRSNSKQKTFKSCVFCSHLHKPILLFIRLFLYEINFSVPILFSLNTQHFFFFLELKRICLVLILPYSKKIRIQFVILKTERKFN